MGLRLIDPVLQEILLAPHHRLADFENGLLALLDVLHELDGRSVTFFDITANVAVRLLLTIEHAAVLRI